MISGIFLRGIDGFMGERRLGDMAAEPATLSSFADQRLLLSGRPSPEIRGGKAMMPLVSRDRDLVVLCSGTIYNRPELAAEFALSGKRDEDTGDADLIHHLYHSRNEELLSRLIGTFACIIYDCSRRKLLLIRDRFGVEPLYYTLQPDFLVFGSTIAAVALLSGQAKRLNHHAVAKFLLFNYNPGLDTLIEGIRRMPAAHILHLPFAGDPVVRRYWKLDFTPSAASEKEISENLLKHLRGSVSRCLGDTRQAGVFLSGGMDSSTVLALAAENNGLALNTFSYRCRAVSFDESQYARVMSDFAGSRHHECEYSAAEVLLMPEVVRGMNEPFCDVGINIATYLLGRQAAAQGSAVVLTGDGGDELFAGHPVYEADKIARYLDIIPGVLLRPVLTLCQRLPDSEQKKSLSVKLKRFAESLSYPRELLSHRWRVYYDDHGLHQLVGDDFAEALDYRSLLADIIGIHGEIQGPDLLSRCLYSDYQTAVDFYLRRNDLIRRFGVESRFPLLDHELVEYAAAMPSTLKIRGWFDTKYIFKKAMEGILPATIIYRKDKLGHSIPLKNWIREDRSVRDMILDHVSGAVVAKRGLFKESVITTLINDHLANRRNNSHRLWSLAVLEMWLGHNFDSPSAGGQH
jgi:asparagine synthase (glutamine-hydrolysing)